jgi:hypothetical protein
MKCGGGVRDGSGRPARSRTAAVGDLEGGGSDLISGQVPASVFHRDFFCRSKERMTGWVNWALHEMAVTSFFYQPVATIL